MIIKNLLFLIGLAYLLTVPTALSVMAAADQPPVGSYQKSCKNAALTDHYILSAECRTKEGKFAAGKLKFTFLCVSDISNQNGVLNCKKSAETSQYKTAVNAFSAATLVVMGNDLYVMPLDEVEKSYVVGEFLHYLGEMFEAGYGQQYQDGVTFPQAVKIVKADLFKGDKRIAEDVVGRAYKQALNRYPKIGEYDRWVPLILDKKEWFATIVGKLKEEKGK